MIHVLIQRSLNRVFCPTLRSEGIAKEWPSLIRTTETQPPTTMPHTRAARTPAGAAACRAISSHLSPTPRRAQERIKLHLIEGLRFKHRNQMRKFSFWICMPTVSFTAWTVLCTPPFCSYRTCLHISGCTEIFLSLLHHIKFGERLLCCLWQVVC